MGAPSARSSNKSPMVGPRCATADLVFAASDRSEIIAPARAAFIASNPFFNGTIGCVINMTMRAADPARAASTTAVVEGTVNPKRNASREPSRRWRKVDGRLMPTWCMLTRLFFLRGDVATRKFSDRWLVDQRRHGFVRQKVILSLRTGVRRRAPQEELECFLLLLRRMFLKKTSS